MIAPSLRWLGYAAFVLAIAGPASAAEWMATKLQGKPERAYLSSRPSYDVERCIVLSDIRGWVYRAPDRPDESYFIAAKGNFTRPVLWRLSKGADGTVRLDVFEGQDNLNDQTEACFDRRDS